MKKYYRRIIDERLMDWMLDERHKPLLLRGARQVGKSSAVDHLSTHFDNYVKIDFERQPEFKKIFQGDIDVRRIVAQISTLTKQPIVSGKTLLFLDEIQLSLEALSSLRYFYEEMPLLHVVAAGSLLEFALRDLPTFGVGRIQSLFLYPMTFDEFLWAQDDDALYEAKRQASANNPLPEVIHSRLVEKFRTYMLVGGMPESVVVWVEDQDFLHCQSVQDAIVTTYEDDFAKYRSRVIPELLRLTVLGVAHQIGQKLSYSQVGRDFRSTQIKQALELLQLAGLVHPVVRTDANGFPLGSEADSRYTKYLYLDSGLLLRMLDMETGNGSPLMSDILLGSVTDLVNKGRLTEMIAGLELHRYQNFNRRANSYFWMRTANGQSAEVDYLLPHKGAILPIEIKAGVQGGMKSLYAFMNEKSIRNGIRSSLENFGQYQNGENHIDILPLYALSNLFRNE